MTVPIKRATPHLRARAAAEIISAVGLRLAIVAVDIKLASLFGAGNFVGSITEGKVLCEATGADKDRLIRWLDFDGSGSDVTNDAGH